jgi:hypothetical protein
MLQDVQDQFFLLKPIEPILVKDLYDAIMNRLRSIKGWPSIRDVDGQGDGSLSRFYSTNRGNH